MLAAPPLAPPGRSSGHAAPYPLPLAVVGATSVLLVCSAVGALIGWAIERTVRRFL